MINKNKYWWKSFPIRERLLQCKIHRNGKFSYRCVFSSMSAPDVVIWQRTHHYFIAKLYRVSWFCQPAELCILFPEFTLEWRHNEHVRPFVRQKFTVATTQQPMGRFTPNEIHWNCLGLYMCNVIVICPCGHYGHAHWHEGFWNLVDARSHEPPGPQGHNKALLETCSQGGGPSSDLLVVILFHLLLDGIVLNIKRWI